MKKQVQRVLLGTMLIGVSTSLASCDFLKGLLDGSGLTLADYGYDEDYIEEHLTGDFSITYRLTSYTTGETPQVEFQKIVRTSTGYYFASSEGENGSVLLFDSLYVKEGEVYYEYFYNTDEEIFTKDEESIFSGETLEMMMNSFLNQMSIHNEAINVEEAGTERIAGRNCDCFTFGFSIGGLAGLTYYCAIDIETGVCLKYTIEATAGGEKDGIDFICTEFLDTNVTLPAYDTPAA